MAGRAGIWLTAKKLNRGLDKTSPLCYNKGIKRKGENNMEIKYAHEMAAIAKDIRAAKRAKDTATARAYLEENLMKDIEDHAGKGENYLSRCLVAIEDEAVKEALKNILRNYGYTTSYSNGVLTVRW